uniref:Uncharacterized protein n=1 Tax=viral metagenome TaxID=1070528 RepID=A0A6C0EJ29_9ZZZZ
MGLKNIEVAGIVATGYKAFSVLRRSPEEKQLRLLAKGEIAHIKDAIKLQNIDNLDGRDEIKNIKLQLKEDIFDLKKEIKNKKLNKATEDGAEESAEDNGVAEDGAEESAEDNGVAEDGAEESGEDNGVAEDGAEESGEDNGVVEDGAEE